MPARAVRADRRLGLLAGLALTLVLAGCGYRGGLEAPPEAKAEKQAAAEATKADPNAPRPAKPYKPFPLDGLLR